jgi:hypothetical protein
MSLYRIIKERPAPALPVGTVFYLKPYKKGIIRINSTAIVEGNHWAISYLLTHSQKLRDPILPSNTITPKELI